MAKYIDLSLPIVPHWRYPIVIEDAKAFDKGDAANVKHFDLCSHWYTHIDAPLHQVAGGKTLDDYPIDMLIGKATILDISFVKANEEITADMLKKALGDDQANKIIIIKTCWEQKTDWTTTDYWDNAPYMSEGASVFIRELKPEVVGFDFPQDYDIRRLRFVDEHECYLTTHEHILKHDILMIEYLTNMWNVKSKEVDFIGLPTALKNADGGQIRVVVTE